MRLNQKNFCLREMGCTEKFNRDTLFLEELVSRPITVLKPDATNAKNLSAPRTDEMYIKESIIVDKEKAPLKLFLGTILSYTKPASVPKKDEFTDNVSIELTFSL
jgi:hypothetical protein